MSRSADTPGSSARRPREDGNATRQKIIEVAGTLFAEKGYAETSSKEITERAGTNIAAVNYHFGSREKLYIAVLDEASGNLLYAQDAFARVAPATCLFRPFPIMSNLPKRCRPERSRCPSRAKRRILVSPAHSWLRFWVAQRFQHCDKDPSISRASALRDVSPLPHRRPQTKMAQARQARAICFYPLLSEYQTEGRKLDIASEPGTPSE